jgi:hypothetical protein
MVLWGSGQLAHWNPPGTLGTSEPPSLDRVGSMMLARLMIASASVALGCERRSVHARPDPLAVPTTEPSNVANDAAPKIHLARLSEAGPLLEDCVAKGSYHDSLVRILIDGGGRASVTAGCISVDHDPACFARALEGASFSPALAGVYVIPIRRRESWKDPQLLGAVRVPPWDPYDRTIISRRNPTENCRLHQTKYD